MKVQNASFGYLMHKKNYSLQTKEGKPINKEDADKIVKRNMAVVAVGIIPAAIIGISSLISRTKKGFLSSCVFGGGMAVINAITILPDYNYYKKQKDYEPERFYKWGGFKVVDKSDRLF